MLLGHRQGRRRGYVIVSIEKMNVRSYRFNMQCIENTSLKVSVTLGAIAVFSSTERSGS